ncbi:glycosyl hydrolase family 47 [Cooperia oncophora]
MHYITMETQSKSNDFQNGEKIKWWRCDVAIAWNGYEEIIRGSGLNLRPLTGVANNQGIFGGNLMPATIVDAADTLWIMDLKDEYKEARDFIRDKFSMKLATGSPSVFETTIRFLGGLLSLYALTGEKFYIDKAREVGEALLPAFNTPSGIPKSILNIKTKHASNYGWADGGASILAEVGTLHLEFQYLSYLTKAPIFLKKVKKVRDVLDRQEKPNGLYPNYINPDTGKFTVNHHVSLGALGDSFYEYLIKSWLQSGKTDMQAKRMYWEVSEAIQKKYFSEKAMQIFCGFSMIFKSKGGLTYVAELRNGMPDHKMGHLACFVVGMFALQAVNEETKEKQDATMKILAEGNWTLLASKSYHSERLTHRPEASIHAETRKRRCSKIQVRWDLVEVELLPEGAIPVGPNDPGRLLTATVNSCLNPLLPKADVLELLMDLGY